MPGRRRAREFALQVLYQADLTDALQSNAFQALYAVLKEDDAALAAAIDGADLALPDGMPVAWTLRRAGISGQPRVVWIAPKA